MGLWESQLKRTLHKGPFEEVMYNRLCVCVSMCISAGEIVLDICYNAETS